MQRTPPPTPDRGGLPLNVHASPFRPKSSSVETKPLNHAAPAWRAQAARLTSKPDQSSTEKVKVTDREGNPVALTPTSNPATPPLGARAARCPMGHTLTKAEGTQLVAQADGLVMGCGDIFCRRCYKENLDKEKDGFYTCKFCKWDCCQECSEKPFSTPPPVSLPEANAPMRPMPPHLMMPPPPPSAMYPKGQAAQADPRAPVIRQIRQALQQLDDDEPFGLSTMPVERLEEYLQYLQKKLGETKREEKMVVTKVEEPPPKSDSGSSRKKAPKSREMLTFKEGDRVQYVSGGRFKGDKRWKDGATLYIGEVGIIGEVDEKDPNPYKCQFDNVYVKLQPKDLVAAPPEPTKAKKRSDSKKAEAANGKAVPKPAKAPEVKTAVTPAPLSSSAKPPQPAVVPSSSSRGVVHLEYDDEKPKAAPCGPPTLAIVATGVLGALFVAKQRGMLS